MRLLKAGASATKVAAVSRLKSKNGAKKKRDRLPAVSPVVSNELELAISEPRPTVQSVGSLLLCPAATNEARKAGHASTEQQQRSWLRDRVGQTL